MAQIDKYSQYHIRDIDTSLVSLWPLNDADTPFEDVINGHDAPEFSSSAPYAALRDTSITWNGDSCLRARDGSLSASKLPDENDFRFGSNESFSVSAWVRFDQYQGSDGWIAQFLSSSGGWALVPNDNNQAIRIRFFVDDGTNRDEVDGIANAVQVGQRHLVVGVCDRDAGELACYINGKKVQSTPLTVGAIEAGASPAGRLFNSVVARRQSHTAVWGGALTANEIERLYERGNINGHIQPYIRNLKSRADSIFWYDNENIRGPRNGFNIDTLPNCSDGDVTANQGALSAQPERREAPYFVGDDYFETSGFFRNQVPDQATIMAVWSRDATSEGRSLAGWYNPDSKATIWLYSNLNGILRTKMVGTNGNRANPAMSSFDLDRGVLSAHRVDWTIGESTVIAENSSRRRTLKAENSDITKPAAISGNIAARGDAAFPLVGPIYEFIMADTYLTDEEIYERFDFWKSKWSEVLT